jgi:hypothetical protein
MMTNDDEGRLGGALVVQLFGLLLSRRPKKLRITNRFLKNAVYEALESGCENDEVAS